MNISVLAVVFPQEILKDRQFCLKLSRYFNCPRNTTASAETFTEKQLQHNFELHFTSYLSTAPSKILPYSKTIEKAKRLSAFGENDSRCLSYFSEVHIFLKL